jgi:glutaredoxin
MFRYVAPSASPPPEITVFTRPGCSHCERAKRLLREIDLPLDELVLNRDYGLRTLGAVSGARTFPQIFVDGTLVGGADRLARWLEHRQAA